MARSRLLTTALILGLLPSALPAYANPQSPHYLLSSLEIDGTPLLTLQGKTFDAYATDYVYNIPSDDFTSITLEWVKPAGASAFVVMDSSGMVRSYGAQINSIEIQAEDFCDGVVQANVCPADDIAPLSEINLTVTSENTQNTINYRIQVLRPLAADPDNPDSDYWNYSFWPRQPFSGIDGGQAPNTISSKRRFIQVPDEGTMFKSGQAFKGWRDAAAPATIYKPGEFIVLDRDIIADPVWIENVPGLSISVEGEDPIVVNSDSPSTSYLAFDFENNDNPARINFTISTDARYQLALYSYPPTAQVPDGFILDAIDSDDSVKPFIDTTCEELDAASCPNLFRLQVFAHNPSGQGIPKTINILLLRRYSLDATPGLRIEWNEDTSDEDQVPQGWHQLPTTAPDGVAPSLSHFLTGFTKTSGNDVTSYEPGELVPILTDQTFEPVFTVVDVSPRVDILGHRLTFNWCTDPDLRAERAHCLHVGNQIYEPEESAFYITLPINDPIQDIPADESTLEVTWFPSPDNVAFAGSSALTSFDVRKEDWYEYEAIPDGNNQIELCPLDDCHEAWVLELTNNDFDQMEFEYEVYIIFDDDPAEQFTVNYANEELATPFQTTTGPRRWLTLPSLAQRSKPDHQATSWTSEQSWEDLLGEKYPVLGDDTVYPVWQPLTQVNFRNGNTTLEQTEFLGTRMLGVLLEEYEVLVPQSQYEFLGWSLEPNGEILDLEYIFVDDSNVYAVWDTPPPQQQNNNPPAPNPPTPSVPVEPPPPVVQPDNPKPIPKTSVLLSWDGYQTKLLAAIPNKYVNGPARLEIKKVIAGKTRYVVLGRAWTHFDKVTKDRSRAVMNFSFSRQLRSTDLLRVIVRGVIVIKSTGEGKSAWK